jgi:hypothetical protein
VHLVGYENASSHIIIIKKYKINVILCIHLNSLHLVACVCWNYALEAIINDVIIIVLVHDNVYIPC